MPMAASFFSSAGPTPLSRAGDIESKRRVTVGGNERGVAGIAEASLQKLGGALQAEDGVYLNGNALRQSRDLYGCPCWIRLGKILCHNCVYLGKVTEIG